MDFGNPAGYYGGSRRHQGSISSSRFSQSSSSSSSSPPSLLPSASPFLSSAFPRYLGSASYPRANPVPGFAGRGATIGIGPAGKYSAYRKSEIDPKQRRKKFGSDLSHGKKKIASKKLSKSDPEIRILGSKPAASKSPSLYEALRNRANMEEKSVPKTAALLKSKAGEVIVGNSLDEFPVSFHPEEELARKG